MAASPFPPEIYEVLALDIDQDLPATCARLARYQVDPQKVDEANQVSLHKAMVPAIKQEPGCRGALILIESNGKRSKVLALSLWENEAQMQAAAREGGMHERMAKFAPFLGRSVVPGEGAYALEHYEVMLQV